MRIRISIEPPSKGKSTDLEMSYHEFYMENGRPVIRKICSFVGNAMRIWNFREKFLNDLENSGFWELEYRNDSDLYCRAILKATNKVIEAVERTEYVK